MYKKLILAIFLVTGLLLFIITQQKFNAPKPETTSPLPTSKTTEPVNIQASFKIITGDVTRNFSNPKYHNKSADVFIESSNPSIVHVKKEGITWQDFFDTLPMKLTKDCLVTGDGERLCNTEGKLEFFLNDNQEPDLLEKQINQGDAILIKFTP